MPATPRRARNFGGDSQHQRFLTRKVMKQTTFADLSGGGYLFERHGFYAFFDDNFLCCLHQRFPRPLRIASGAAFLRQCRS